MLDVPLLEEIRTDSEGYQHLIGICEQIRLSDQKEATLDFSRCVHFDANLSAVLGSMLDELKMDGYSLWLTTPPNQKIADNLSRNNFFRAFNPQNKPVDSENFIEYKRFEANESEDFKSYIETQLMQKQRFPSHTDQAGKLIQESIFEIFVNAVDHGNCKYVYSCGEYDPHKSPPCLDMTIVDRGHSIPSKVNDYFSKKGWQPIKACDAIQWAMVSGNTTKAIPGGLGLAVLVDFLKLNQGMLQIVSGEGMIEYRDGRLYNIPLAQPFNGTIVNMEFNFDDNKKYSLTRESIDLSNLL